MTAGAIILLLAMAAALEDVLGQVRALDMDDVRAKIAEAEASAEA